MSAANWVQILVVVVLIGISTPILGSYMAKVYSNKKAPGDRVFLRIERAFYRLSGIDPEGEQRWNAYAYSLLAFSAAGVLLLYALLRLQEHLPLNPDHLGGVSPGLSFNVAISMTTNTDWQTYAGESTLSHLLQTVGLVTQFFLSAAVGAAVVVALLRAFTRHRRTTLGSFWVDVTRTVVRILLPISFVFAVFFMSQGVIANFHASQSTDTVAAVAARA